MVSRTSVQQLLQRASTVQRLAGLPAPRSCAQQRRLQQEATSRVPDFAFAFDIDGVLLRGNKALPRATETLNNLQRQRIPFLLLTNGGGYHESKRAGFLSKELDCQIDESIVLQSHTPFQDLQHLKEKTVLVVGGEGGNCREVARQYGFQSILTPSDIFTTYPSIWPFSQPLSSYHTSFASTSALPHPIDPDSPSHSLQIDAIFVYNDPRDWGLDASLLLDCLLSKRGILGTLSAHNGNEKLPNQGYLQDGQPHIYFSNNDLWYAAEFPLPRLGQGGFRAALEGLWRTVSSGAKLDGQISVMGKPNQETYEFAESRLMALRKRAAPEVDVRGLRKVYMIGDNPASDIAGANGFKSVQGTRWDSILVRTGVFDERKGPPSEVPTVVVEGVGEAVDWALEREGWGGV